MKKVGISLLILTTLGFAAEKARSYYHVTHLNQSVVGISCPGNNGDPTVIGNYNGVLLVSCGN